VINTANDTKMKNWIKAFRLRTLPLSFSTILMGSALAIWPIFDKKHAQNVHVWWIFGLTLLTTLLLQILSNLANDYGDSKKGADNAERIGPARSIQSGEISPKAMFRAIVIITLLTLIAGIFLLLVSFDFKINWFFFGFFVLGIAAIGAAIKYTMGKKAYGYSGFGDVFVFIFFGLVGVYGTYFLQTHTFNWILFLPATAMGCFSVAVLNLNNMRDHVNDEKVGKNTIVVKLGLKNAKRYHYSIFALAYLAFPLPLIFLSIQNDLIWLCVFILPILLIHLFHLKRVYKIVNPKDFDPELKVIALSTFLFSLLFFVTLICINA
jgi:1,4-dihydroxy-2-naphthoate octaprenyltransferase